MTVAEIEIGNCYVCNYVGTRNPYCTVRVLDVFPEGHARVRTVPGCFPSYWVNVRDLDGPAEVEEDLL